MHLEEVKVPHTLGGVSYILSLFINLSGGGGVDCCSKTHFIFVYYESMKRNLLKPIYECRCNGRLQAKRFTRLAHTRSVVELEHLKINTRLTNEKFASVKGECEI